MVSKNKINPVRDYKNKKKTSGEQIPNGMKIGIIGIGVIGEAMASVIPRAILYDKYKNIGSIKEINGTDIIFICVPTPFTEKSGFDLSAVEDVFSIIKDRKVVVIKSTVLPGTTERMQKRYPQHRVLFNPEFLREATAKEDIRDPAEQIIGYTKKSKCVAEEILRVLPKGPAEFIVPAAEAEMVKYFSNVFLCTKVIFANQIYDLCKKLDVNYDLVKEMASVSPRFAFSHFEIFQSGYRGYRGACLPKDMKSLIQLGDKIGVDLELLKMVEKINNKLLNNGTNV